MKDTIIFTDNLAENARKVLDYLELENEEQVGEMINSFTIHYKEGEKSHECKTEIGPGKFKSAAFFLYLLKSNTKIDEEIVKSYFTQSICQKALDTQGSEHQTVWLLLSQSKLSISFNFTI